MTEPNLLARERLVIRYHGRPLPETLDFAEEDNVPTYEIHCYGCSQTLTSPYLQVLVDEADSTIVYLCLDPYGCLNRAKKIMGEPRQPKAKPVVQIAVPEPEPEAKPVEEPTKPEPKAKSRKK